MELFSGLKHEHKIYKEDFESGYKFEEYFEWKKEKLEEIKAKIEKLQDQYEDFEGHELEDEVMDKYEDILKNIDAVIDEIEDQKASVRE